MGKNKQQAANEARAKKAKAPEVPAALAVEEVKATPATPAPAPAAQPATPVPANKQTATFDTLKAGWLAKGVDLSKMTVKPDGKFTLVVVAEGWPTVQIGPTGGITVVQLKSYQKAFDAAMDGLALYEKQQAREAKKAATPATAPEAAKAPVKESTTAKKQKADAQLEQQLQSAVS